MYQDATELACAHPILNTLQCVLLGLIELKLEWRRPGLHSADGEGLRFFDNLNQFSSDQGGKRGVRYIEGTEGLNCYPSAGGSEGT